MKCPKCGYNSFEHLSSCKKCHADLTAHKENLGIRPLVLPASLHQATPASTVPEETTDNLYSWDIADNTVAETEPLPIAPGGEPPADNIDISFTFDDLPDSTFVTGTDSSSAPSTGKPAPASEQPSSFETDDEMANFADMIETIDREAPVQVTLEDFNFGDLEGFKKVDIFAEDTEEKGASAGSKSVKPDDIDDIFRNDEKTGGDGS